MDFTVCPHAHYYYASSATACKNYVTNSVGLSCFCVHACGLTWSILKYIAWACKEYAADVLMSHTHANWTACRGCECIVHRHEAGNNGYQSDTRWFNNFRSGGHWLWYLRVKRSLVCTLPHFGFSHYQTKSFCSNLCAYWAALNFQTQEKRFRHFSWILLWMCDSLLSASLALWLSGSLALSLSLSLCLSVCLSVRPSVRRPVRSSVGPSVRPSVGWFVCLFVCLSFSFPLCTAMPMPDDWWVSLFCLVFYASKQ